MKIGSEKPERSGTTNKSGEARLNQKAARKATSSSQPVDPTTHRLSELADKTRRDIVDRADLQSSMKDKLLVSRNRTAEIRQRIQAGYYGRPEVVRSIVDRLADYLEP